MKHHSKSKKVAYKGGKNMYFKYFSRVMLFVFSSILLVVVFCGCDTNTVTTPESVDAADQDISQSAAPKRAGLLQDYPNESNPETWIPYQLAERADVTIKIYNVVGQLVQTLELGYQSAGYYISRDKAAYWDCMDNSGEKVASGVYYYTFQAGNFSATRKMVILK